MKPIADMSREEKLQELKDLSELQELRSTTTVSTLLYKKQNTDVLHRLGVTLTPNGEVFNIQARGFLPEMMEELYEQRSEYKSLMIESQKKREKVGAVNTVAEGKNYLYKKYTNDIARYNNIQLARKVQLNSAYGALGNQYFRFYDTRLAEAVTKAGQLSIRWIENRMNKYLNKLLKTEDEDYIVASDTDSIYITFDKLISSVFPKETSSKKIVDFIDKVSTEKLEPFINKCYVELAEYMNAYDQKMFMSREVIADKGIWTAKKRYILNVHDSEGVRYAEPKIKIMGIEAVKSSTPGACREKLRQAMKILMNDTEDDIIRFIEEFRKEFILLPAEEISFPRGVNGVGKYKGSKDLYIKGTPVHVKGALLYNKLVKDHKLTRTYPFIHDGDKIKFAYLKEPNPLHESVISISSSLPSEFGIDMYIDYEKQFEKAFVGPLRVILQKIGWNTEKVFTLDDFFS